VQDREVIAYVSRKLKPHEELYATHNLELAVVILALKIWKHYLVGRSFALKNVHQSLQYLFTQRDLNARQRRWSEFLSEYDFEISYIKGKKCSSGCFKQKTTDILPHTYESRLKTMSTRTSDKK